MTSCSEPDFKRLPNFYSPKLMTLTSLLQLVHKLQQDVKSTTCNKSVAFLTVCGGKSELCQCSYIGLFIRNPLQDVSCVRTDPFFVTVLSVIRHES